MLAVHNQYIPEDADELSDYYISAVICPDKVLQKFPRTRFFTCMLDPLYDDQVKLAYRMHLAKVDVRINLFRHLEHGILTIYPKDFLPGKIFQDMVLKEVELAVKMPGQVVDQELVQSQLQGQRLDTNNEIQGEKAALKELEVDGSCGTSTKIEE